MPCFCLVRLTGVTQIPRFKRKNLIGYVEYWNAGCGESRMSGVDAGKERKLLPMHTRLRGPTYRYSLPPDRFVLWHSYLAFVFPLLPLAPCSALSPPSLLGLQD